MFLTKRAIPRRTVLRGLGAAFALPLLDAMVPSATALANTPAAPIRRLGCFYLPNGANPVLGHWAPTTFGVVGKDWELTPQLAAFESVRDQLFVPYGLTHNQANGLGDGGGDHARSINAFITGSHAKATVGSDVEIMVKAIRVRKAPSSLRSIKLSLVKLARSRGWPLSRPRWNPSVRLEAARTGMPADTCPGSSGRTPRPPCTTRQIHRSFFGACSATAAVRRSSGQG